MNFANVCKWFLFDISSTFHCDYYLTGVFIPAYLLDCGLLVVAFHDNQYEYAE